MVDIEIIKPFRTPFYTQQALRIVTQALALVDDLAKYQSNVYKVEHYITAALSDVLSLHHRDLFVSIAISNKIGCTEWTIIVKSTFDMHTACYAARQYTVAPQSCTLGTISW